MLDQTPQEIFQQILTWLEPADLKALRLVNNAFADDVLPALFRKITISCLTLDRLHHVAHHDRISTVVEEMQYQEMSFDDLASEEHVNRQHQIEWLVGVVTDFIEKSNRLVKLDRWAGNPPGLAEFLRKDWEVTEASDDDIPNCATLPNPGESEIKNRIRSLLSNYADVALLQQPWHLYEVFSDAFWRLTNLRRVTCVEADAGGIALNHPYTDQAIQPLQSIFPVSDSAIRMGFQQPRNPWPAHGFLAAMRALGDDTCNPGIQHLEIQRNDDLFHKRGVSFDELDRQDEAAAEGFRNLKSLKLCLEVNIIDERSSTSPSRLLTRALSGAWNLQHLEISLTTFSEAKTSLSNIFPRNPFPALHTVVLEEMHFSDSEICSWLFVQPKLRDLTLRRPYLQGYWKEVVQRLSQRANFMLDSIQLTSPWDFDIRHFEAGDEPMMIPARVSNEHLLAYINNGGVNPFERRHWVAFDDSSRAQRGFDDVPDDLSEYSDISEWSPTDHPDPVEDPEGPEFNENYDFDAEENSDVEMDEADCL